MKLIPFRSLSRDLYADIECSCQDERFPDLAFMKTKITLTGYCDDNFFDNVNREPRTLTCKCGRSFSVQWRRDGVLVEWLDAAPCEAQP